MALPVLLICSCSKHEGGASGAPALPEANLVISKPGAFLAYEHEVQVTLAAEEIPARLQAVQASCLAARFGDCTVLAVRSTGGDRPGGTLEVRIVPKGVEPIIQQAAQGAEIGSRDSHAEDLAEAVAGNDLQRLRLRKEHARLLDFQSRSDLKVADMIALSKQLSEIEAGIEIAEREGAQQRRRIDTQRVTLEFRAPGGQQGRSEIAQSLRDFGGILSASVAWMVRAFAGLLPVVAVLWLALFFWRRRRRKAGVQS